MHIHSSQYNYITWLDGPGFAKLTARGNIAWLWEVTLERQVMSHDPSVTSMVLMV